MKTNTAIKDINSYNIAECTHELLCKHCIGSNTKHYVMECVPLETKNGMVKILVFGDRYWKGKDDVKKIRWVESKRVKQKQIA